MKLGIVVGHNAQAQGAVRTDTGESEFSFNSRIAKIMQDYAAHRYPTMQTRVFFRRAGPGYTSQIRETYAATDAWGATLTMELHFNGSEDPTARGSLMLTSGSPMSMRFAVETQKLIVARFNARDRGVSTRRTGRGSASLITGRAPAILVEPFFGSSSANSANFDEVREEQQLAEAYIDATAATLDMLPRQDLTESRTMREADRTKSISGLGKYASALGLGAFSIDNFDLMGALDVTDRLDVTDALPWIVGLGLGGALLAFFVIPAIADAIKEYRRDDQRKMHD